MTPGTDWIDQAQRLVEAVRVSLASAAPETDDTAGTASDGTTTTGTTTAGTATAGDSADCRWCPVCQAAAVVRGERPEVGAALADLLTAAAAALRTVAAAEQPAEPTTETPPKSEPPAPVQQIDLA